MQTSRPQDDDFDPLSMDGRDGHGDLDLDAVEDVSFEESDDSLASLGDHDVFAEDEAAPAPKKRNWFNIGVGVAAVVLAAGLILPKALPSLMNKLPSGQGQQGMQGQGAANDALDGAQLAQTDANQSRDAAAQAVAQPDSANLPAVSGLLDNPGQAAALNQQGGVLPADMPAPPSDPFAALNTAQPAPANTPSSVQASAPVAQAASDSVPMPAPIAMPAAESAPAPVTVAVTTTAAPSTDVTALQAQVQTLNARMDSMSAKLDDIASRPAQAAASPDMSAIQESLARMESRLDALSDEKRIVVRPVSAAPKAVTATRKARSAPKREEAAYRPARATPVSASAGNGGWELRGANPGSAVVARGGDIREIHLGDSLSGLGDITGIAQMGGQWVVQGTKGRISQ